MATKYQSATPLLDRAMEAWRKCDLTLAQRSTELHRFAARMEGDRARLVEALRSLLPLCDNVPVFQLDDGKASVKAVRLAGKFVDATRTGHALLRELGEE